MIGWFLWAVYLLDTIFVLVLDGGEMCVKLWKSGSRTNLDTVLAD